MSDAPASPIATQETVEARPMPIALGTTGESFAWLHALAADEGTSSDLAEHILTVLEALEAYDQFTDRQAAALSSAERRNEDLVRAAEGWKTMFLGTDLRATKAEATIASLTGTVGELREALSREQAHNANLRRTIEAAADRCADAALHGTEEMLRSALEPSPPGISTTGGDGEARKDGSTIDQFLDTVDRLVGKPPTGIIVRPLPRPPGEPEA